MNELVQTELPSTGRTNDPARTMAEILAVATREFADKGLAGARIDAIADATRTSKRMIYYYFENKEGLYLAVLEDAYRRMRHIEGELRLQDLPPEAALKALVGFTLDYQWAHPEFIRLVMNENMLRGAFLARSQVIQNLNVPAIDRVREIYEAGVASGVFRPGIDPVDLHRSVSALSVFNIANQHTFGLIFQLDMADTAQVTHRRREVIEMIWRYVKA